MWIDAICIDQGNATERAQQVSMMADVYAAASSVIIWLGLESVDQDGYHAITTMKGAAQSRHRDYPFKREMSHLWERQDLDMGTRISRYLRYCWILGRHVDGETLEIASTEFERFDAVFNASQGPGSQQTTLAPSQLGASEASGSNCWLYTLLCRFSSIADGSPGDGYSRKRAMHGTSSGHAGPAISRRTILKTRCLLLRT